MNFSSSDDLSGAEFRGTKLAGTRFIESDLSGVVARGCELAQLDLDSPWLAENGNRLLVNGVDVIPYVEAELDRRFPGRAERTATDPAGLRSAWAVLEQAWAPALERAAGMPAGTVDASVAGEWSFAETLRHLVLATDAWLGRSILGLAQPFHPIGKAFAGSEQELDPGLFTSVDPPYDEVLAVRAQRQGMVRDFLAAVTPEELATVRTNPWGTYPETTLSCLHVILQEEWEHLRYALRDLDELETSR